MLDHAVARVRGVGFRWFTPLDALSYAPVFVIRGWRSARENKFSGYCVVRASYAVRIICVLGVAL